MKKLYSALICGLVFTVAACPQGQPHARQNAEKTTTHKNSGNGNRPTAAAAKKGSYQGIVTSVADGDTVRLTDENGARHKIRMAYIDAPELHQAYGQASRDALRKTVERERVQVEVFDTDQYGREVARIVLNGRDINLAQIQAGNAWHYQSIARRAQSSADYQSYQDAQERAKSQRAGLWRDAGAQAPWAYRKQQRAQEQ